LGQVSDGVDVLRAVGRGLGMVQGWGTRGGGYGGDQWGREEIRDEGGESRRRFPGDIGPGEVGDGGCGRPFLNFVYRDEFGVGRVTKRAGGGAKR